MELCRSTMMESYQNLRERIGSCIATIVWFDLEHVYIDPSFPAKFRPPKLSNIMSDINPMVRLFRLKGTSRFMSDLRC